MSSKFSSLFVLVALFICSRSLTARQDDSDSEQKLKPIKAMLVTGGCCHDYELQKKIITKGISDRCKIKIDWTIVHQGGTTTDTKIPLYEDKDWAKGYDIVIHNECFAKISDKDWVERVLKPHREGVNAIVIHCAMHTFRDYKDNEYRNFLGVTSRSHGPHHSFKIENLEPKDPIMKGFGKEWSTPKGELYYVDNIGAKTTPLGRAVSSRKQQEVCIWKNEYGKSRVFGTTIGHHNETMASPKYLNMLTRGFLWAVDRLDENIIKSPPTEKVRINLANRKVATSSSHQNSHVARAATDGQLDTRYCAENGEAGHWFQVDLGKPEELTGVQVHWEHRDAIYRFKLEGSKDGKSWKLLHDASKNTSRQQTQTYAFEAGDVRFLKMTCTETQGGSWFSFWEFRALGTEMIEVETNPLLNQLQPLNDPKDLLAQMKYPESFDAKIYAAPPQVNYPVCLTSSYAGVVYVGVDKNGSLARDPGRGSVVRCRDTDQDGVADEFKTFCKVDSPRGMVWDRDRLYVLHPPDLSVYFDNDGDGEADRKETLVEGIGFGLDFRGADHTTNGIRMGIDGWIYIAVGDYGFIKATGADGKSLQLKGGGVVRVKPDGSNLEVYARGLRNICDIAIDPQMNIFTRDNTNDGGGWDIRVSHIMQNAHYGYPSLYKNFDDEIMPPLADYGGGSGTGAMFVSESTLPEKYRNALFTCDWGRSMIFYHDLDPAGATYTTGQEDFLKIPRPTDMDVDAAGNVYVASWRGGKFKYEGENIGFVAVLSAKNRSGGKLPQLEKLEVVELVGLLKSSSHSLRHAVVRELVKRNLKTVPVQLAEATEKVHSLETRIAAISAIAQIRTEDLARVLSPVIGSKKDPVKAFAIRTLSENWNSSLDIELIASQLNDVDPVVQRAALAGLARIGDSAPTAKVIAFASKISIDRSKDEGVKTPVNTSAKALRHLAIQTLVRMGDHQVLLQAVAADSQTSLVATDTLRYIHSKKVVDGLLEVVRSKPSMINVWTSLVRLYHKEGPYVGKWWGTRPDTSGPYYDRLKWNESDRIGRAIEESFASLEEGQQVLLANELKKHKIQLPGIAEVEKDSAENSEAMVKIPEFDKDDPNQLGNIEYPVILEEVLKLKGSIKAGARIFKQQSCAACHSVEPGAKAIGPQLMDIGKRYNRSELLESIMKPSAKIAQGFTTQMIATDDGLIHTGFVVREAGDEVELRDDKGKSILIKKDTIEARKESRKSVMPDGLANNLTAKQMASLLDYLNSLKTATDSKSE